MPPIKYQLRLGILSTAAVVGLTAYNNFVREHRVRVHPHFLADRYVYPLGCPSQTYRESEDIPLSCASRRYVFDDWDGFGLGWPGPVGNYKGVKVGTYYRVGNDLIGFRCSFGECTVQGVERNVYNVR